MLENRWGRPGIALFVNKKHQKMISAEQGIALLINKKTRKLLSESFIRRATRIRTWK